MANHSVRVSTLDEKVTVYDLEGNIIKQIPEPPEIPPKVTYFNIVEYEDRLMGIDPDAKPEFFIDLENDMRFNFLEKDPRFQDSEKKHDWTFALVFAYMLVIYGVIFLLG